MDRFSTGLLHTMDSTATTTLREGKVNAGPHAKLSAIIHGGAVAGSPRFSLRTHGH